MSTTNPLDHWQLSREELGEIIAANPSLRGMILGYAAEFKLRSMWFNRDEITDSIKYDDHDRTKKGDLVVTYKSERFIIECKSLQTNLVRRVGDKLIGKAQCDASDRRTVTFRDGSTLETTCLLVGEFDLLAVNLFAFNDKWSFGFAKNSDLPTSKYRKYTQVQRDGLLASLVPVTWPLETPFRDEPYSLLDEIIAGRRAGKEWEPTEEMPTVEGE